MPEGKDLPKSVRLRIMLARSIAGNPKLILLEDNFNQLRKADKKRFLDYLIKSDASIVAVSNDKEIAKHFNKIIILSQGKIVANDSYSKLSNNNIFQTN